MPGRCIVDATVHPMTTPDARADGICWDDEGRIVAVGSRDDVIATAEARGIQVESLPGTTLLPGFVDAHMHFLHVGVRRIRPDLRSARSLADALNQVATWLRDHPGDEAIIAEGWDESSWPEGRFPTRDEADGVAGDRPLVLRRQCGHFAVANSAALPLIRARWDDDELVDRESGVLKEAPSLYLNEVMPVSPGELDDALQVATDIAHRLGVTCVGEYTQAPFRDALLRSAEQRTLRIRIANHIYVQQLDDAIAAGFRTGTPRGDGEHGVERMRDGGLKVFHDGSFGGRTALLRAPYRDDPKNPDNRGNRVWTDAEVDQWYQTAHEAGVQITAHVIGDAAIDQGLDGYERLKARCDDPDDPMPSWDTTPNVTGGPAARNDGTHNPTAKTTPTGNGLRHRFEHYELPHDDAVQRTVDLGIVACAQPNFLGEWSAKGGMYERRLGEVFLLNNRYRTFLERGVDLCFGSDGMPFGPLYGIQASVDHPVPEERLTPAEAVWLYTQRAAWACHWDDHVGSLEVGKRADVLILNVDALDSTPPKDWCIAETVLDGDTVARNEHAVVHADALTA